MSFMKALILAESDLLSNFWKGLLQEVKISPDFLNIHEQKIPPQFGFINLCGVVN